MKIAVIGATGTVAQESIKALKAAGHDLKLFSRSIEASAYPSHEVQKGDVFNDKDLDSLIKDCQAVHVSIGQVDEAAVMKKVVDRAKAHNIELVSYVSGATVSEANSWFPMIGAKYRAEQILKQSGIPHVIMRPTFFMEAHGMMVQGKRASVIGKQPNPVRFISGQDFGQLLSRAYEKPEAKNATFYAYGPEAMTLNQGLEKYVAKKHPEIKKVSNTPYWMIKTIATLSGNKMLKEIIAMFKYFENTREQKGPEETEKVLGKTTINLETWLEN